MRSSELWDDLLGRIADAALDPGAWQAVIERATEVLEARSTELTFLNLPMGEVVNAVRHRLNPDREERWAREWVGRDPWAQALYPLPANFVAAGSAVLPYSELRRSEYYHEYAHPNGLEACLVAALDGEESDGRLYVAFYGLDLFDRMR